MRGILAACCPPEVIGAEGTKRERDDEGERSARLHFRQTSPRQDPRINTDGHCAFYVLCTFQNSGALNLRMPWTFFRKAVGINHSPQGTYTASLMATFWSSSAIAL